MSELSLVKMGANNSSNGNLHQNSSLGNAMMRDTMKKIVILHRVCTTRGDLCKHLRYLGSKIASF
jgi:hypothetical protein